MRALLSRAWEFSRQARILLAPALARRAGREAPKKRRHFWQPGIWLLLLVVGLGVPSLLGSGGTRHAAPTPALVQQVHSASAAPTTQPISPSEGAGGPHATTRPADSCGITNIGQCLTDFINSFLQSIANWWQTQINNLTALGFIFSTPASVTYNAPIVQQVESYSLSVVGAFLALTFAVAGYNYMVGRSLTWTEILPQIVLCGMMAWGILPILILAIDLANDFIGGLQGINLTNIIAGNSDTSTMGMLAFIFELILDMGIALEALVRLALLDLLIALAPIGIFCFALPQSRAWGRLWAEAFVATLLIQPLQAVAVLLGSNFLATAQQLFGPNFPPIVQILLGIACAYLAIRIPSMLSRVTHITSDARAQLTRIAMMLAA